MIFLTLEGFLSRRRKMRRLRELVKEASPRINLFLLRRMSPLNYTLKLLSMKPTPLRWNGSRVSSTSAPRSSPLPRHLQAQACRLPSQLRLPRRNIPLELRRRHCRVRLLQLAASQRRLSSLLKPNEASASEETVWSGLAPASSAFPTLPKPLPSPLFPPPPPPHPPHHLHPSTLTSPTNPPPSPSSS